MSFNSLFWILFQVLWQFFKFTVFFDGLQLFRHFFCGTASFKRFKKTINTSQTFRQENHGPGPSVLVECMTDKSAHAIAALTQAACYCTAHEGKTTALVNTPGNIRMKNLAQIMGADSVLYYTMPLENFVLLVMAFFNSLILFKKAVLDPSKGLQIQASGIEIGDLVYDDYLEYFNQRTMSKKGFGLFVVLIFAAHRIYRYKRILKKTKFDVLVLRNRCFTRYGVLARLALDMNIKILVSIYSNPLFVKQIESKEELIVNARKVNPCDMDFVDEKIPLETIEADLQSYLNKRLYKGLPNDFDTLKIQGGSEKILNKPEFCKALGLEPEKPVVFIMSHAFKHCIKYESWSIYRDFYSWLIRTLELASEISNVQWVVKLHPVDKGLDNKLMVQKLGERFSFFENLIFPESKIPINQVLEVADGVVTCSGTIGFEAACAGIPVVAAGDSAYYGLGISRDSHNEKEYFENLLKLAGAKSPANKAVVKAAFIHFILFFNRIDLLCPDMNNAETLFDDSNYDRQEALYRECIADGISVKNSKLTNIFKADKTNPEGVFLNTSY